MNKDELFKIIPLSALILLCSGFVGWQVARSADLKASELRYQEFLAAEQERQEALELAKYKDYLMGKFEPSTHEDFAQIPPQMTINNTHSIYLRKEALESFTAMAELAREDGIILKIASATRNFDYQKNIWNNKWTGYTLVNGANLSKTLPDSLARFIKILEYSSVPGTSRHHWGTDIDLNDANTAYFNKIEGIRVYEWLTKNAAAFGFCQPYNQKGEFRPSGYNEEKWHWSYIPLARKFTADYSNLITLEDITGFYGDENVAKENLIRNYVLGINPDCF